MATEVKLTPTSVIVLGLLEFLGGHGTPYDLKIVAAAGHITVSYNGVQKADIPGSGSG